MLPVPSPCGPPHRVSLPGGAEGWLVTRHADARAVLRGIGDPELAYTTVKTVLERLTRKQVVTRVNIDRTWHYSPAAARRPSCTWTPPSTAGCAGL